MLLQRPFDLWKVRQYAVEVNHSLSPIIFKEGSIRVYLKLSASFNEQEVSNDSEKAFECYAGRKAEPRRKSREGHC